LTLLIKVTGCLRQRSWTQVSYEDRRQAFVIKRNLKIGKELAADDFVHEKSQFFPFSLLSSLVIKGKIGEKQYCYLKKKYKNKKTKEWNDINNWRAKNMLNNVQESTLQSYYHVDL